jgi:hypothetical protein
MGRFKALRLRDRFEVLFVWLIGNGILSQWRLLKLDGERIAMELDRRRMASQTFFAREFPPPKIGVPQPI